MSFPGFILRTGSVQQSLFPSESPNDTFSYYDFIQPGSFVYTTQDYISAGIGGLYELGSGASGSVLGAALLVQLFDWNDVVLIDSLLMPGIEFTDESCPQNTTLVSESACDEETIQDEINQLIAITSITCTPVTIVDEAESPVTMISEE